MSRGIREPDPDRSFCNECQCCFMTWQDNTKLNYCSFCTERPHLMEIYHYKTRLRRVLDSMDKATIYRFPEIIRMMAPLLDWDKDDD